MRDGGTPPSANAGTPLRLVCFELRDQELALPIGDVRETLPMRPITPGVPDPAVARRHLQPARRHRAGRRSGASCSGLPRTVVGDDSRIVVVERGGNVAGVVVDRLRELRTIDAALEPPPPTRGGRTSPALLLGVAATPTGTVRVLDRGRDPRLRADARARRVRTDATSWRRDPHEQPPELRFPMFLKFLVGCLALAGAPDHRRHAAWSRARLAFRNRGN